MPRTTRTALLGLVILTFFTGVAAAQGDAGGVSGLVEFVQSIIDALQSVLDFLNGAEGGN
jgi:hypothetical protein